MKVYILSILGTLTLIAALLASYKQGFSNGKEQIHGLFNDYVVDAVALYKGAARMCVINGKYLTLKQREKCFYGYETKLSESLKRSCK